jgi:hypothetical protein
VSVYPDVYARALYDEPVLIAARVPVYIPLDAPRLRASSSRAT